MKKFLVITSDGQMTIEAKSLEEARNAADMIIRHEDSREQILDIRVKLEIEHESSQDKTFDVVFNNQEQSNSKGFKESIEYCKAYIQANNGTSNSYFADYKGGIVSIVDNETGETVYEEEITSNNESPVEAFYIGGYRNGNEIGVIDSDGKMNYSDKLDFDSRKFFDTIGEAELFLSKIDKSKDLEDFQYVIQRIEII